MSVSRTCYTWISSHKRHSREETRTAMLCVQLGQRSLSGSRTHDQDAVILFGFSAVSHAKATYLFHMVLDFQGTATTVQAGSRWNTSFGLHRRFSGATYTRVFSRFFWHELCYTKGLEAASSFTHGAPLRGATKENGAELFKDLCFSSFCKGWFQILYGFIHSLQKKNPTRLNNIR
jgi:hypothetical protein